MIGKLLTFVWKIEIHMARVNHKIITVEYQDILLVKLRHSNTWCWSSVTSQFYHFVDIKSNLCSEQLQCSNAYFYLQLTRFLFICALASKISISNRPNLKTQLENDREQHGQGKLQSNKSRVIESFTDRISTFKQKKVFSLKQALKSCRTSCFKEQKPKKLLACVPNCSFNANES